MTQEARIAVEKMLPLIAVPGKLDSYLQKTETRNSLAPYAKK